ncbi:uncharacterized protein DNG_01461 [Cephalotrichum gorgonifer]|uniref:His_Phos_1 domain-containing protein n=1 Tax=Cephalotrichum gorgonifer TaxID=2041049 RepID=A0AAE8SRV3_9PEZI|nr:uncharacterized protein DNG_01461 [Cephalotrichum gorgonifer]
MGKPPAYIFVVRHGNRLDVADKTWAANSPTPYDPPLTYGGWLQARTVGAKIASIITDAEAENEAPTGQDSDCTADPSIPGAKPKKKKRRFKVALHSSPFLRCIQTSVGISAGLCEPPGNPPPYPRQTRSNSIATSQVQRPLARRTTASSAQSPVGSGPLMNPLDLKDLKFAHRLFPKVALRLDPFLGEWLAPEYFETISPPPSASSMLATAKADLLRWEDYSKYPDPGLQAKPVIQSNGITSSSSNNNNTQLWKSDTDSPLEIVASPLDAVSNSTGDLPDVSSRVPQGGYIAPMPHYAISNNTKIPEGYVAHARDACLTVDCQWDSSSPPQNWGDGGAYGEEWTGMHRRFRNGIQHLVEWYAGCDNPTDMNWKMAPASTSGTNGTSNGHQKEDGEEEEDDVESVVVLVSHGAGCNALIGAITHQPALMDVGLASITLAVRRPMEYEAAGRNDFGETTKTYPPVHQCYDLKMTANTDHLRGVTTPAPASPINTSSRASGGAAGFRGRGNTTSSMGYQTVLGPFTYTDSSFVYGGGGGSRKSSAGATLGLGAKRESKGLSSLSTGTAMSRVQSPGHVRQTSLGLWSPIRREEDDEDFLPDFDNKRFNKGVSAAITTSGTSERVDTTAGASTDEPVDAVTTSAIEDVVSEPTFVSLMDKLTIDTSTSASSSTLTLPDFDRPTKLTEAGATGGGGLWSSGRSDWKRNS